MNKTIKSIKRLLVLALMMLSTQTSANDMPIIINEVLANEPGSATSLEWVELYNRADTSVNLAQFVLVDGDDSTTLSGLILPAGEFAIIARRLIADPGQDSFESFWGDNSGVWGDAPKEDYLAGQGNIKLRNSADTVSLHGPTGGTSLMFWDTGANDGYSLERLRPDSPDARDGFLQSTAASGCTPGRLNSLTPRPNDLAIDSAGIVILTPELVIKVPVTNVGLGDSKPNTLSVGLDQNNDTTLDAAEIFAHLNIMSLPEGDTDTVSISLNDIEWSGTKFLIFIIEKDGNEANNSTRMAYRLPFSDPEVVINEYLPDPLPGASEEWIELYNCSESKIDQAYWQLGDSVGQVSITAEMLSIPAGAYYVFCENREAFEISYPGVAPEAVFELAGWRSLNNSGDKIMLRDNYGFVVDSLTFVTTYDGERSVERINPTKPASDPDNWWGCVDTSGGTPGRVNSIAVGYTNTLEVTVSPNPFVRGEPVEIFCTVPRQTYLSATIYDINGRKIKTLLDNQPQATGTIIWDGAGDQGRYLSPGMYVLLIHTDRGVAKKIVLAVAPGQ